MTAQTGKLAQSISDSERAQNSISFEGGSYRDRRARVFSQDGKIFRVLDFSALDAWRKVSQTQFFRSYTEQKSIIRTSERQKTLSTLDCEAHWVGLLEHERVPFLSYAYEWSFGMLRDAALLHLELLEQALLENFTIKDSSHFNIQWNGVRPYFIDIASFEPFRNGEPWTGYRQFCEMFLFPLMLKRYRGIHFQDLLRASLEGVSVPQMDRLISFRDLFRPGVFKHVRLQNLFQAAYEDAPVDARGRLKTAGFHRELILANVRGLRKLISGFRSEIKKSVWSNYASTHSYSDAEMTEKKEAVDSFLSSRARGLVWDLGSNSGEFSEIAAQHADYVVALDADPEAIERLYQRLRSKNASRILPLVMDITDPSPALGFSNLERETFLQRGRPSVTLALALIHHIVIGANVPLPEFVRWLSNFGGDLVLEFVSREDEMTQRLLRNKEDIYHDYSEQTLEQSLLDSYSIDQKIQLKSGKRILYCCSAK